MQNEDAKKEIIESVSVTLRIKKEVEDESRNSVNNFSFNKRDAQSLNESVGDDFSPIMGLAPQQ